MYWFFFFFGIIYVLGILEQFGTENYTRRLNIVQHLCEFCQFFSELLWQNVLILRIRPTHPDKNVSILFVNILCIGNIRTIWHRNYTWRLDIAQSLWQFRKCFLFDFWTKCFNTLKLYATHSHTAKDKHITKIISMCRRFVLLKLVISFSTSPLLVLFFC